MTGLPACLTVNSCAWIHTFTQQEQHMDVSFKARSGSLFVIRSFLASAHECTERFRVWLATADAFTVQSQATGFKQE